MGERCQRERERIAACHRCKRIENEIKLEASRGEGRHGKGDKQTRDKHEKRERGILTRREIERTWKHELLRDTASVEQRNTAVLSTVGQCGSVGRKGYTDGLIRRTWAGRAHHKSSATIQAPMPCPTSYTFPQNCHHDIGVASVFVLLVSIITNIGVISVKG